MNYVATSFIYDGIPSEKFGLFLCNLDETGSQEYDSSGNITIHTTKTPRMDRSYLMGVEYEDMFEFELVFGSSIPQTKFDIDVIMKWLIGHNQFKKLQIVQEDMANVYFNCIMTEPQIVSYSNVPYAFKCKVICDSPYALTVPKLYYYNKTGTQSSVLHFNNGQINKSVLPIIRFTCTRTNGAVMIINKSNNNWKSEFIELQKGEIVTVDNQLQTIASSLGRKILSNFNKHWFELVPKRNELVIDGDLDRLEISYSDAKLIG